MGVPAGGSAEPSNYEAPGINNVQSSQQMSFRDQKFLRVDQSMMYSVNNIGKTNQEYNSVKLPESTQK